MKFFKSKLVYVILPIFALVMGLGLFFGVGLINRNTNVFDMDDLEDVVSESVSDYEVEMKKYNISNCTFENSDVFAEVRYGEDVTFTNCVFDGATESAIYASSSDGDLNCCVVSLIGCQIINSDSGSDNGWGLAVCAENAIVSLINTTIENNTADFGNIIYALASNLTIDFDETLIENNYVSSESKITGNQAINMIYAESCIDTNLNNVNIVDNITEQEEIYGDTSGLTLRDVTFDNDSVDLRNYVVSDVGIYKQVELIPVIDGVEQEPVKILDNQKVNQYTNAVYGGLMPITLDRCAGWFSDSELKHVFELNQLDAGDHPNHQYKIYTKTATDADRFNIGYDSSEDHYYIKAIDTNLNGDIVLPAAKTATTNELISFIEVSAFQDCSSLTSVTLSANITNILEYAFKELDAIESVNLTDNIEYIGEEAFMGCSSLEEIYLSDKLESIFVDTFNGCSYVTELTVPANIKSIGNGAFAGMTGLEELNWNATQLSTALTSTSYIFDGVGADVGCVVNFGKNVKEVPAYLFYNHQYPDIIGVNFAENSECETIGGSAFSEAISTETEIILPNKLKTIGAAAFNNCYIDIPYFPETITTISKSAFAYTHITQANLPSKITTISNGAFMGCTYLEEITIPENVTSIQGNAFYNCTGVRTINYNAKSVNALSSTTHAFNNLGNVNKDIQLNIGNQVQSLPNYLFYATSAGIAPKIAEINFEPNSVCASIGTYCFYYNNVLSELTLPSSVTNINAYAFRYNTALKNINLNEGLTTISHNAFSNTTITHIYIPSTVSSITMGSSSESFYGCQDLASIMVNDSNATYSDGNGNAIINKSSKSLLLGCYNTVIPTDSTLVTTIGYYAFHGLSKLENIYIPSNISSISTTSFYNCPNIKTIVVDEANTTYRSEGSNAIISSANSLMLGCQNTVIPNSVTSINNYAFQYSKIKSIDIPSSVTSIGAYAFRYCSNLTTINLSSNLTAISSSMFYNCTALSEITIPDSVTSIGSSAFYGCMKLSEITIPEKVTNIGSSAFYNCYNLSVINFNATNHASAMSAGTFYGAGAYHAQDWEYDNVNTGLLVVNIGPNVTRIPNNAFAFANASSGYITEINFAPNGVCATIGANAFGYNTWLKSIMIPNSVTTYSGSGTSSAFYGCNSSLAIFVASDTAPSTTYFTYATNATYGVITTQGLNSPSSAQGNIVYEATYQDYFEALASDWYYNDFRYTYNSNYNNYTYLSVHGYKGLVAFPEDEALTANVNFYIPHGATIVAGFSGSNVEVVSLPNTIIGIEPYAFQNCSSLEKVEWSNNLEYIGDYAFENCSYLFSVDTPYSTMDLSNTKLTEICDYAFAGTSVSMTMEKVILPETIQIIGIQAFINCEELSSINFPDSLTSIGGYAFSGCAIETVVIDNCDDLTIGVSAFENNTSLLEVRLNSDNTLIAGLPQGIFRGCTSLETFAVDYSSTIEGQTYEIGRNAFYNCFSLKNVNIEGFTKIGTYAFYRCGSLETIKIPYTINSFGAYPFYFCSGLKEVYYEAKNATLASDESMTYAGLFSYSGNGVRATIYISNMVRSIPANFVNDAYDENGRHNSSNSNAFGRVIFIENWVISGDCECTIGDNAFRNLTNLRIADLGDWVTTIGENAFYRCAKLEKIWVPSILNVKATTFKYCTNLTLYVPDNQLIARISINSSEWAPGDTESGVNCGIFDYEYSKTQAVYYSDDANGYEGSGDEEYAFFIDSDYVLTEFNEANYTILTGSSTAVIIPEGVKEIGASVFADCTNIQYIVFPTTLEVIGNSAFNGCTSLTEINLPEGLTTIGEIAFGGCDSVTKITIPSTVTSIGNYAFFEIDALEEINYKAEALTTLAGNATTTLSSHNVFANSGKNSTNGITVNIENTVTTIPASLFYTNTTGFTVPNITTINLNGNTTTIGKYAFYGLSNVTTINYNIRQAPALASGNNVFAYFGTTSGCVVNIGENVESIPAYLFYSASSVAPKITAINWAQDGKCTTIGSYAFNYLDDVTSLTIPSYITTLNSYCFGSMYKLQNLYYNATSIVDTASGYWPFSASGSSSTTGGINIVVGKNVTKIPSYIFNSTSIKITGLSFEEGSVCKSIGNHAFSTAIAAANKVVSITLPDSIETIGEYAFHGCNDITTIAFPSNLRSIGTYAFQNCTALEQADLPANLRSIATYAFNGCTGMNYIVLPQNLKTIGTYAFNGCTNIYEIYYDCISLDNLTNASHVFYNVNGADVEVSIGSQVSRIPNYLFYEAGSANRLKITTILFDGKSLQEIGSYAFYYANITSLSIPDSVKTIGSYAFQDCSLLTSVDLGSGLVKIDARAFYNNKKISSLTLPSTLEYIGNYAFYNSNIKSITIPSNVSYIGIGVWIFLTSMTVSDDNPYYTDMDSNVIVQKSNMQLVCSPYKTKIEVPYGVEILGTYSIVNSMLTELHLPKTIKAISNNAIYYCNNLPYIKLPSGIEAISSSAFYSCANLKAIYVSNAVVALSSSIASSCPNVKFYTNLPNASSRPVEWSSTWYGSYTVIYTFPINATNMITFSNHYTYANVTDSSTGYVIGVSVTGLSSLGTAATKLDPIPEGVTHIADNAFNATTYFSGEIILPSTLVSIGRYAFAANTNITSITIPENVTQIGHLAFSNMYGLTKINYNAKNATYEHSYNGSVNGAFVVDERNKAKSITLTIGNDVEIVPAWLFGSYNYNVAPKIEIIAFKENSVCLEIADCAFMNLGRNLIHVELSDSIQIIGASAFYNTGLRGIILPSGITEIYEFAFYNCLLSTVILNEGLTDIGESAFANCSNLTSIHIPSTVSYIASDAFNGCANLTQITINEDSSFFTDGTVYGGANVIMTKSEPYTVVIGCQSSIIPTNCTVIGDYSFSNSELVNIVIPNGVTTIGNGAFSYTHLVEIEIPDSVTTIYSGAFIGCDELERIKLSNALTSITASLFNNCSSLTEIMIPSTVTSIGSYAFSGCSALERVAFDEAYSLTLIHSSAFKNCISLKKLYLPSNITSIDYNAFSGCTSLVSINIPSSVTSFPTMAAASKILEGTTSLKVISYEAYNYTSTISTSAGVFANAGSNDNGGIKFLVGYVNNIPANLLYTTTAGTEPIITEISFVNTTINSIGNNAFGCLPYLKEINYNVTSLTTDLTSSSNIFGGENTGVSTDRIKVTIGENVSIIPNFLFDDLVNVSELEYGAINATLGYNSMGHNTFYNIGKNKDVVKLTIKNTVQTICAYLFNNLDITNIEFEEGSSCTTIGNTAFAYLVKLKELIIPKSVTYIGSYAMDFCTSLKKVYYENPTGTIDEGAFYDCTYLSEIWLGASKETADSWDSEWKVRNNSLDMYTDYNYVNKTGNIIYGVTLEGYLTGFEVSGTTLVKYVGTESIVEVPNYITTIGASAFSGRSDITQITLPDTLKRIGDSAFAGCSGLAEITIPNSVTTIGNSAFFGCSRLDEITIPNSVTTIGEGAFSSCTMLRSVSLPDSVTSIGSSAFTYCGKLTTITIPSSVKNIPSHMFYGCYDLYNINLPDAIEKIDFYAFYDCGLTSIDLPDSLTRIEQAAFRSTSLTEVTIPATVNSIGASAFYGCDNLANVYNYMNSSSTIGQNAFNNTGSSYTNIVCAVSEKPTGWHTSWYGGNVTVHFDVNLDSVIENGGFDINENGTLVKYFGNDAEIVIPDSVTDIADYAFEANSVITSVEIPDTVTTIGNFAFMNCSELLEVNIPSSIESVGEEIFTSCTKLEKINIDDFISYISMDITSASPTHGVFWNNTAQLYIADEQITTLNFYDYLEADADLINDGYIFNIFDGAFAHCESLTSVIISAHIKEIGEYAFAYCENLTEIYIDMQPMDSIPEEESIIHSTSFENDTNATVYCTVSESLSNWDISGVGSVEFDYPI